MRVIIILNMVQFDEDFSNAKIKELHTKEEERAIQNKAPVLGFPYINLKDRSIHPEALSLIPEKKARDIGVAGFDLNQHTLSLAANDPKSPEVQEVVGLLESKRYAVILYICSSSSLEKTWERYGDIVQTSSERQGMLSINSEETAALIEEVKQKSDVASILKQIGGSNSTRRISETASLIFAGAIALKASDIHIEPEETGIRLRYRLDGVLHDVVDLDSYMYKRLMSRLKLLSGMTLNVNAEAQDGRFTFDSGDREVEVRSSIIPGAYGESVVMRVLDPTVAGFTLDKIDLNEHIRAVVEKQLKRPNGLIITTGPTGSGKTTALYAFLREVHDESKKIITIENPVEYKIDGIVHTQTDKDYTFANGLRAVLRQDPDVIMVGEIRDREVAETAIHAAQTGHLVFSTLHTNSAIAGFNRLIDLGVNKNALGGSLNLILGQRLLRKLCVECRQEHSPSGSEKNVITQVMNTHPYPVQIPDDVKIYKAGGCVACGNTGFKGRMGVFEGVLMDDSVEEVIMRDPREHSIREAAKAQKIPTMLEDGIDKVLAGVTSMAELERVVEFPQSLSVESAPTLVAEPKTETAPKEGGVDDDFESHIV